MEGFEVLGGELSSHAGKVDGLTDRMRTAVDAANTVTMDNSAYGVVCQPFAMLLQPFEELGVRTLRDSAEALADTARKVRDTVRDYDTTETAEATRHESIEADL
ncbi:ESX-1 secretion-associated protein [Actinophytocola xinjiangensis]|uniref:ESX-1 secretion-associated protein n=1 Tax=Actinophytocola xinjiangensis TaxID=485602 RepID=A0A7Z0WU40_9PSEU|nr:type VII secretion target [Actinophytocola xinjiangensis]OLF13881.1 ESX-1 secretion-associated protein [Actinophytocola xinjiangensis]